MVSEEKKTESPLLQKLIELAEPVVLGCGLELVELQFRREGHGWVLRLIIDSEQGISVDNCADVSREFGHLLEVENIIEQAYTLEVSSPGLDRPLRLERDFVRARGKKAKIVVREPVEGLSSLVGVIQDVGDGRVTLSTDCGSLEIDLSSVKKARLVIDF